MIIPALILFWVFLTLRVVHGETLVGDRQWWVTKPYEWWKLLLAKELFLSCLWAFLSFWFNCSSCITPGFPFLIMSPGY